MPTIHEAAHRPTCTQITTPFPCLVVDEFLPAALFREVQILARDKSNEAKELHPSGYAFHALFHSELVRCLIRFVKRELPA